MTETARPHLFIATPMYGGMCTGAYARSMILLCTDLTGVGIDWNLSFTYNESLITRGRNFLVQGFLEVEAATRAAEFFVALPRGVCGYGVDGSVALLRAAGLRRP